MSCNLLNKILVIGVLFLFVCGAIFPFVSVVSKEIETQENIDNQDEKVVTCYVFDKSCNSQQEVVLSSDDFEKFYSMFEDLNHRVTYSPFSSETEVLKADFADFIENMGMIPKGLSKDEVLSLMNPSIGNRRSLFSFISSPVTNPRGFAFFCNFATWGEGSQFPVIILPRLIPILLIPIPRVIMSWNANYGITSCGGLLSGKGFIAEGAQKGTALGFWGIGFSVFLPPVMSFGFIGYALFATASAEIIIPWPPNRPPGISGEDPPDDTINVPISLSELSFSISDLDGDRMNYSVTTSPYIGGGSGNNVVDGTYSVPVSNLDSDTKYSWRVVVSDGEDIAEKTFSFYTQIEPPFVSDPLPVDGDDWVSVDISELSFRLEDFQSDPMDYSVETVPNVGGGSGSGVGNGVYSVPIGGIDYTRDYTWFVNVTDGKYWVRKVFSFRTQPIMVFDPFDMGWQFRKQITINHSEVAGDLVNFPVLISLTDVDLRDKAQVDGDDILFMDGEGVAGRLLHEIELYNGSSGELVAWVNVSSLSSGEDSVLYLYYGNSGCGSQEYSGRVWDSNYVSVWHMDGSSYSEFEDSTSNGFDATGDIGNPTYQQSAKVGHGVEFDGIDDMILICDDDKFSFCDSSGDKPCSFEAWINTNEQGYIISKYVEGSTGEWIFQVTDLEKYRLHFRDSIGDARMNRYSISDVTSNTWLYLSTTFDGGTDYKGIKCYINGIDDSSDGVRLPNYKHMRNNNEIVRFGGRPNYEKYFDGLIDEMRISNIKRSSEWINTSYNMINNPFNFVNVGPEELGS